MGIVLYSSTVQDLVLQGTQSAELSRGPTKTVRLSHFMIARWDPVERGANDGGLGLVDEEKKVLPV